MGIFERRDSKYWWLWLEPTDQRLSTKIPIGEGKARRKASRAEAEEIYHAAMGDLARKRFQIPGDKPRITFAAHAEWYRDHVAKTHKGGRREASIINGLIKVFGPLDLTELDAGQIEEWKTARASLKAVTTVNRELDVLKPLLRSAVPKYLEKNPADAVKRIAVRSFPPVTILTPDAEDALLAVATPEERALVLLGLDALLRLGDARTLEREHDRSTYLDIVDPKTGRPYKVPISPRLRLALNALPERSPYYFGRRYARQWKPMGEATAFDLFAELCERADVPHGRKAGGVTFHALRHTGATRAASVVKLSVVQKLGGWSSLKQLARYDHPDDPEMVRAVAAIGSRSAHGLALKRKNRR